jgi:hypothetical protein
MCFSTNSNTHSTLMAQHLSGSPTSWIARGRSAPGAGLSASRNLRSGMKAQINVPACGVRAGTEDDRLR